MEIISVDNRLINREGDVCVNRRNVKVSVCLATYNGTKFIREQIKSILGQLHPQDELIIVDDCSTDGTYAMVYQIGDSRISLYQNTLNIGVIRTFEKAITAASGDIIFLSDQDDVWMSDKIETVLEFLEPNLIMAVVTDAIIIDAQGRELFPSYFEYRGSAPGYFRNFVRNSYIGCTMAFTKEARSYVLPFPKNLTMHDEWIGIVCELLGEVKFVKKKLISYRRHGQNVSGMTRKSWIKVIVKRLLWIKLLIVDIPQRWARRIVKQHEFSTRWRAFRNGR